jgi:hypothetical protein
MNTNTFLTFLPQSVSHSQASPALGKELSETSGKDGQAEAKDVD